MAPSRGLLPLLRTTSASKCLHAQRRSSTQFAQFVTDPARTSQIYISRTLDPFLNLSIEHFLLQKSSSKSTILFLYTNRPCIVIGRNQNPWVELNLSLLNKPLKSPGKAEVGPVELVRRRSGGGTVFHDEGNVNYSVICPTAVFDRDKHAEMVVRALRNLGVDDAKVNERHDIVLAREAQMPLKVSGSAYKLTRLRSVHHGTCLLSSPNIKTISQYLRSPAKPYIKARGVDSVSSPITNVNVANDEFEQSVVHEFGMMYGSEEPVILSEETMEVPEIAKGLQKLRSLDWTYLQTPQFTFSSYKTEEDPRDRPSLPEYLPTDISFKFTARNGSIIDAKLGFGSGGLSGSEESFTDGGISMIGTNLHLINDWRELLPKPLTDEKKAVAKWLNALLGRNERAT